MPRIIALRQHHAALGIQPKKKTVYKPKALSKAEEWRLKELKQLKWLKKNIIKETLDVHELINGATLRDQLEAKGYDVALKAPFPNRVGFRRVSVARQFTTIPYEDFKKGMKVVVVGERVVMDEMPESQWVLDTEEYRELIIRPMTVVKKTQYKLELEEVSNDAEFPVKTLHVYDWEAQELNIDDWVDVKVCHADYLVSINNGVFATWEEYIKDL